MLCCVVLCCVVLIFVFVSVVVFLLSCLRLSLWICICLLFVCFWLCFASSLYLILSLPFSGIVFVVHFEFVCAYYLHFLTLFYFIFVFVFCRCRSLVLSLSFTLNLYLLIVCIFLTLFCFIFVFVSVNAVLLSCLCRSLWTCMACRTRSDCDVANVDCDMVRANPSPNP